MIPVPVANQTALQFCDTFIAKTHIIHKDELPASLALAMNRSREVSSSWSIEKVASVSGL